MPFNVYASQLSALRRKIENRIDEEVDEAIRGRGNSRILKDSLLYIINDANVLNGAYKKDEKAADTVKCKECRNKDTAVCPMSYVGVMDEGYCHLGRR